MFYTYAFMFYTLCTISHNFSCNIQRNLRLVFFIVPLSSFFNVKLPLFTHVKYHCLHTVKNDEGGTIKNTSLTTLLSIIYSLKGNACIFSRNVRPTMYNCSPVDALSSHVHFFESSWENQGKLFSGIQH